MKCLDLDDRHYEIYYLIFKCESSKQEFKTVTITQVQILNELHLRGKI